MIIFPCKYFKLNDGREMTLSVTFEQSVLYGNKYIKISTVCWHSYRFNKDVYRYILQTIIKDDNKIINCHFIYPETIKNKYHWWKGEHLDV